MIVARLPESRDARVPYTRMATAEANMRDQLREHGIRDVAVRAVWAPAGEVDVLLEVTNLHTLRSAVVRP